MLGQGHVVRHSCWRIQWRISTSTKVTYEHFSLALTVFEIFTFQNSWHWKCRSRSFCTTFAVSPFDRIFLTSYLMAIVMFAVSNVYLSNSHLKRYKMLSTSIKVYLSIFRWISPFSKHSHFKICDLDNVPKSGRTKFAVAPFSYLDTFESNLSIWTSYSCKYEHFCQFTSILSNF